MTAKGLIRQFNQIALPSSAINQKKSALGKKPENKLSLPQIMICIPKNKVKDMIYCHN